MEIEQEFSQLLLLQEHFRLDARLIEGGAQRAFGHIARVVRDGGEAVGARVMPDLVAAGGLAMEHEPERLQSPGDVAIPEPAESSHQVATMSGRSSYSAAVGRFVAARQKGTDCVTRTKSTKMSSSVPQK